MNPSGSGAIQPSHFYTQPSPTSVSPTTPTSVSGPDLVERRKQFQASITPMLAPNAFTGAGAVNTLVGRILEYGLADIDANMRMEILGKIRDGAGNHYFRAWGENSDAMDITREWLKAGFSSGNGNPLMETVMPLLQVIWFLAALLVKYNKLRKIRMKQIIDRIPLTLDGLKASKLGRLVVKLTKEPPTPGECHPIVSVFSTFGKSVTCVFPLSRLVAAHLGSALFVNTLLFSSSGTSPSYFEFIIKLHEK